MFRLLFHSTDVPNIRVEFSTKASWVFLLKFLRPLAILWGANWFKSVLRKYIKTMAKGPDSEQLQLRVVIWLLMP